MQLRRNAIANLVGRLWTALMSFAFVPVYIRLLGIEAYGLIGFFASLMAVFVVLDLGFGITLNRELSRNADDPERFAGARDLFRTFEVAYWVIGLLLSLGIILAAPAIVRYWLNLNTLDYDIAVAGIRAMGCTVLFRWPVGIYTGALLGMQQQVRLNVVVTVFATLASGGAAIVLALVSRNIAAFFVWQALVAAIQIGVLRHLAWGAVALPGHRAGMKLSSLRATIGFSGGVTGIALLSVILTQMDKLFLSQMLSLELFATYALAATLASIILTVGAAIENATFPALARLVAAGDTAGERRLYHQASQGSAILIIPPAMAVIFFAPQLLSLYLQDGQIALRTAPFLQVLIAGNAILAMMFLPLALQYSHGWTRLSLGKNIVAVAVYVPLLLFLVHLFGPIGAACSWLVLTIGYLTLEIPLMHRRLLPQAKRRWYLNDIGIPTAISLAVMGTLHLLLGQIRPGPFVNFAAIAAGCLVAVALSLVSVPELRELVRTKTRGRVFSW